MIDQRALEAMLEEMTDRPHPHDWRMLARLYVELYEGAKPSPWSPIEAYDRENDDGNWILVHKDQRMPGSYDLMFWDETHEWCVAGGDRTYTHADLVERGGQFRTIAPPSSSSTSPAAEEGQE